MFDKCNLNYYLALFRMPKKVAKKIISLRYNFFWGVKDGGRAIPLDGLGVGDLVMKNAALLFK